MAYRHYEVEGLIINHRNLGEANRLYQVLTDDFGLINVLAQGVRLDKSKLRHHLQNFSFARLVLVRGREFWRVVGVSDIGLPKKRTREVLLFFKKISLVLLRLIHGEDPRSLLYQDLKRAFDLILARESLSEEELANLEIFILARIFLKLGYLAEALGSKKIFSEENFSWPEVAEAGALRISLIRQINQALELSQL